MSRFRFLNTGFDGLDDIKKTLRQINVIPGTRPFENTVRLNRNQHKNRLVKQAVQTDKIFDNGEYNTLMRIIGVEFLRLNFTVHLFDTAQSKKTIPDSVNKQLWEHPLPMQKMFPESTIDQSLRYNLFFTRYALSE
jgi:hypothetical protein